MLYLSVILPIYNEAQGIPELFNELAKLIQQYD